MGRPAEAIQGAVCAVQRACPAHGVSLAAALPFSLRAPRVAATVVRVSEPSRIKEISALMPEPIPAMLTTGSRAHYDYAVWPGRRSAQAAPSALTRPKGA